ncbi:MAG: diphosphomevalonate decarboxylase [Anaerolineales bacterium]|nr:diphosphomevalonate decarboxylase [Anaerolineales bacterium]
MPVVTAIACSNIALIKYWGDRDTDWHIPANGSISMNLDGLFTLTTAITAPQLSGDQIIIDAKPAIKSTQQRVVQFLDRFRQLFGIYHYFRVESTNNFPSGTGIASSASAFAALSLAVTTASGINLSEAELSRLARLGSGSACRSIPGGFVEWQAGHDHASSFSFSIAPPAHWPLVDCIVIVQEQTKQVSSLEGHALAVTSPLQSIRISHADQRLSDCRKSIMSRDFDLLARIIELDCHMMHAVMITSDPPLLYWQPATLAVMQSVIQWRKAGLPVCYTIDAGANIHVLCEGEYQDQITERLREIPGVIHIMHAKPGGSAYLETDN